MKLDNKKLLLFAVIGFLALWGFIKEAEAATYYATGTLYSTNLLSGQTVNSIEYFGYDASTTATSTIKVQFSQNNSSWYSANHTADTWETLSNGDNLATSSALTLSGWSAEPNWYYKMLFETSDTSQTAELYEIKLWYNLGGRYPTVTTQAASNLATSSATFNGNINDEGEASSTERGFQYDVATSTSPSYSVSETGTFGAGAYNLNATTSMAASTTYYVRAYVSNAAGTAYGSWQSFTTNPYYYATGTVVSTNLLSGQTVTSIDSFFASTTVPAGTSLWAQFATSSGDGPWYDESGTLNATTSLANGTSSTDLSGLGWSGANFYYKMWFNANSARDATPEVEEIQVEYTSNTTPANPTASDQLKTDETTSIANQGYTSETSLILQASTTDADATEVINLFFETATSGDTFISTTTPTTAESCVSGTSWSSCQSKVWYIASASGDYSSTAFTGTTTVAGLTDATGYKWQVKACDDTPACSSWVEYNATTPNFTVDTTSPTTPGTPSAASPTTDTTPTWTWTASTDTGSGLHTADAYTVQWDTDTNFGAASTATSTSAAFTHSTPLADATWYARVKAEDAVNNQSSFSASSSVLIDTSAPTSVSISITADSVSQLTITATATDSGSGLHATPFWFSETSNNSGSSSSTSWQASTSFIDTNLSANTEYIYKVKAKNTADSESSYSATSSKYTLVAAPSNLTGTAARTAMTLTIASFTNDTASSSGYYFWRTGANSGWLQTNSWQDTSLSCGTSYTWYVKYRNGDGTETANTSLTASTSACPGGGMPSDWNNPPKPPANGFQIFINDKAGYTSSRKVFLSLTAGPDTERMALSSSPDFQYISQEPYVQTKQWDLCQGQTFCPQGQYSVYAKFYAPWGTASEVVSASIFFGTKEEQIKQMEQKIRELLFLIAQLQAQLKELTEQAENTTSLPSDFQFLSDLQYNQTSQEVSYLQLFLKAQGPDIYPEAIVSGWFGPLTKQAVIRFQEKYALDTLTPLGLEKGTGFVGSSTRAKINQLLPQ
ncbi:MAG: peptidoglycan-binding protein [bacterium]